MKQFSEDMISEHILSLQARLNRESLILFALLALGETPQQAFQTIEATEQRLRERLHAPREQPPNPHRHSL